MTLLSVPLFCYAEENPYKNLTGHFFCQNKSEVKMAGFCLLALAVPGTLQLEIEWYITNNCRMENETEGAV